MEQYINKAEVIAEIDRKLLKDYNDDEEIDEIVRASLVSLKYYICTLKVKDISPITHILDTFIEKAKKWFEMQNEGVDSYGNYKCDMTDFEDFKSYMEGE